MKKILGLDLGVASVGWALIETDEHNAPKSILAMGSRIVPLAPDDASEFSQGKAISKNSKRTQKRTQRKGYDRYQMRRAALTEELRTHNMLPDEALIKLPVLELWQLRADAATRQLTLPEIGRVLYHINQKRGYRHAKSDSEEEKSQRDYVQAINDRYAELKAEGKTIGQHFADKLKENCIITEKGPFYTYRIKEQVYPRAAYMEEFDRIISCQKGFYPTVFTDAFINRLRNEIIFYQRNLKSCKHLINQCEFSQRAYKKADGSIVIAGPKVAPRTSPLFQICKIWECINNLQLTNRKGEEYPFTLEQRKELVEFLDNHEKLTLADLYKIIGVRKSDGWWGGKAIGKGLQGNTTKCLIKKALGDKYADLLRFDLQVIASKNIDTETGEVLEIISPELEKEPLFRLWHILYSMQDKDEMAAALHRQFGITEEDIIDALYKIDFVKPGYGNKSSRFMREILPYLQKGMMYSDACNYIGINHSNSITSEENAVRELKSRLPQLQKNELRQPVIEKVLNQMVNVVNALLDKYGEIDEIRVELARELKQSKDERNDTYLRINKRERENAEISKRIEEYGIRPSRSRIQKYRLWEEADHICFYCGQPVGAKEFLSGVDVEIEHIIPRSLFFDDSFSNKVCACRKCNQDKGNSTAFDYMKSKSEVEFDNYLRRVEKYYNDKKISKTKRDRLLTAAKDIPQDFIDRQLRQSQYISKKAIEMLKQVCRYVWATSGSVTDFIRHNWGYDKILHDLNFERYKSGGLTGIKQSDHIGQEQNRECIIGWTKRLDHRHHALDALTIASTQQGYIQRLNHLNTERNKMFAEVEKQSEEFKGKYSLLEEWMKERPHISVEDVKTAVDQIAVSFKAGKKVATPGKRYIYKGGKRILAQDDILVPRGALSEESVYGSISTIERNVPAKNLFEHPERIFKGYIRKLVEERIAECGGDWKKARTSLNKRPIFLDDKGQRKLEYATCWKEEMVLRYPIEKIDKGKVDKIVDGHILDIIRKRIEEVGEKNAFKEPLYADEARTIPIRHVRLFTGLSAVEPIKYVDGQPVGFVKPGNNHHIAFYVDAQGNKVEHVVTFWNALERKKYGFPVIIEDTDAVWEKVDQMDLPEAFVNNLPKPGLKLDMSLQQNEMFILGMGEDEYYDAMAAKDYKTLCKHLYRVQNIANLDYYFRLHIDTSDDKSNEAQKIKKFYRVRSISSLMDLNPKKVKISILGEIFPLDD